MCKPSTTHYYHSRWGLGYQKKDYYFGWIARSILISYVSIVVHLKSVPFSFNGGLLL